MKKIGFLILYLFLFSFLYCGGSSGEGDIPKPSTPTGLTASDGIYANYIVISWDSVDNADEYVVYRGTSPDNITAIANLSSTYMIEDDLSIRRDIHYWYKVAGRNCRNYDCVESEMSYPDEGWASNSGSTVEIPRISWNSDEIYSDYIRITWYPVTDEEYYNIYRSTSESGNYIQIATTTLTLYDGYEIGELEDYDVTQDTHYWYKVTAVDSSSVESPKSDEHEAWTDSFSTYYTFRLINGTSGFLTNIEIDGVPVYDMKPGDVRRRTYSSKPASVVWNAGTDYTGMGEDLSWGNTFTTGSTATDNIEIYISGAYFSLWIKNSSSDTWNRFYYNSTVSYYNVNLPPDTFNYYWMGFFSPVSTSNYWQTTVDATVSCQWGSFFAGGASYTYQTNSYGSNYVNCVGED